MLPRLGVARGHAQCFAETRDRGAASVDRPVVGFRSFDGVNDLFEGAAFGVGGEQREQGA
ncbi:MAG: hypothetical protein ACRDQW_00845 [Haloechinothrix sp.]